MKHAVVHIQHPGQAGRAVLRQRVRSSVKTWLDFLYELRLWPCVIAGCIVVGIGIGWLSARITLALMTP